MDKVRAIEILLQKQDEYAKAVLSCPKGKKGYDFGEMVGIYKGYQLAIDALTVEVEREAASEKEDDETNILKED